MIDDLKPYPSMKDSGVPWLGEVPAALGRASTKRRSRATASRASRRVASYCCVGVAVQGSYSETQTIQSGLTRSPDDLSSYKVVEPGDLVSRTA